MSTDTGINKGTDLNKPTGNNTGTFRSLRIPNYRLWASGAIFSNIGTWMQRTAQDWLVLSDLTHHNATALGTVMALQFGPQILLLPWTGYAADRFDRRRLIMLTQAGQGLLALGLGLLTVLGHVQLWEVYLFAGLLGCVTAFDAPARQSFVSELVGEEDLANATGLNSTLFNSARMVGPAIAGLLIARVGTGWVFLINAVSFVAVLISLSRMRTAELHRGKTRPRGGLLEGFRYVWQRPDLRTVLLMLLIIGTFGLNFPIFISKMSVDTFGAGAREYGLLSSMMAIGSVTGALLAARREHPTLGLLLVASAIFGLGCTLAALMPHFWLFGLMLIPVGVAAQTLTTSTNSYLQLNTEAQMRGRVVAIMLAVAMGTTPIGAPIVGWVADHYGARWSLGIGALAGFAALLLGLAQVRRRPEMARA